MTDAIGNVYQTYLIFSEERDASPYLCRDSESGNFLLTWEWSFLVSAIKEKETEIKQKGSINIASVIITFDRYGNLTLASFPGVISITTDTDVLDATHPRCAYSQQRFQFYFFTEFHQRLLSNGFSNIIHRHKYWRLWSSIK